MSILIAAVIGIGFVVLTLYVTWLFVRRLRNKELVPRSFLRWLRDLYDLALGL